MTRSPFIAMVVAGFLAGSHARADLLVSHPPRPIAGQTNVGNFCDNRQNPATTRSVAADNLTLATGAAVTTIRWWGSPAVPTPQPGPVDPHADITSFRLELFADAGSPARPGGALRSVSIPLTSISIVSTGDVIIDRTIYQYEAALPAPWSLDGSTQYWFCPSAEIAALSAFRWSWRRSTAFDGRYATYGPPGPNVWTPATLDDFAFELVGTVPAPGTATIIMTTGIFTTRRRRDT